MIELDETKFMKQVEKLLNEFFEEPVELKSESYPIWIKNLLEPFLNKLLPSFIKNVKEVRVAEGDKQELCLVKDMEIESTISSNFGTQIFKIKDKHKMVLVQRYDWLYDNYKNMRSLKKAIYKPYMIARKAAELGVSLKVTSMHTCLLEQANARYIMYVIDHVNGLSLDRFYADNPKVTETEKNKIKRILTKKIKVLHENNIALGYFLTKQDIYIELDENNKVKDVFILSYKGASMLSDSYQDKINIDLDGIHYLVYDWKKTNTEKLTPLEYISGRMVDKKIINIY